MSVPKPSESKALIPAANTGICPKVIQNFIRVPELLDRLVSSIWNEDGSVTDEFKASVGLTVGDLAAPSNVTATDGVGSSVALTWSPVTGASSYKVFRATTDDSSGASQIGSPSSESFTDTSATSGQVYYYWVKATNAGGDSDFSSSDSGYWGTTTTTPVVFDYDDVWTVPSGITTIGVEIEADGGGGGGGALASGFYPVGVSKVGGGGGGSGSRRTLASIAVSEGQEINIKVGSGGAAGSPAGVGGNGEGSSIATPSDFYFTAGGQGGGAGGVNGVANPYAGSGGVHSGTGTDGNTGTAGSINTGGPGGAAVDGSGAGGAGGAPSANGTAGSRGKVTITPNG